VGFTEFLDLDHSGKFALFRHNSNLSARAAVRSDGMIDQIERRIPWQMDCSRRLFFCLLVKPYII
jgi:hypothetical protein